MVGLGERVSNCIDRAFSAYEQTLSDDDAFVNAALTIVIMLGVAAFVLGGLFVISLITFFTFRLLVPHTGISSFVEMAVYGGLAFIGLVLMIYFSVYYRYVFLIVAKKPLSAKPPAVKDMVKSFFTDMHLILSMSSFFVLVNIILSLVLLGIGLVIYMLYRMLLGFLGPHLASSLISQAFLGFVLLCIVAFFEILIALYFLITSVVGLAGMVVKKWNVVEALIKSFVLARKTFLSMATIFLITILSQAVILLIIGGLHLALSLVLSLVLFFLGPLVSLGISFVAFLIYAAVWTFCEISLYRYVVKYVLPLAE